MPLFIPLLLPGHQKSRRLSVCPKVSDVVCGQVLGDPRGAHHLACDPTGRLAVVAVVGSGGLLKPPRSASAHSASWKIPQRLQRCAEGADPERGGHVLVQGVQCSDDQSLPGQCGEQLLRAVLSLGAQSRVRGLCSVLGLRAGCAWAHGLFCLRLGLNWGLSFPMIPP